MPIRFRCHYCNQLLGIARRKGGSEVRCPTCAGMLKVPNTDQIDIEADREEANLFVFDRNDFDDLLQGNVPAPKQHEAAAVAAANEPMAPVIKAPPSGAWGTHAEPAYRERFEPTAPALANEKKSPGGAGVYLSRQQLIIVSVAVIGAIVAAFAMGVAVGWLLHGPGNAQALHADMHPLS